MRSFPYTPRAGFYREFLLLLTKTSIMSVSLTLLMLVLVKMLCNTPDASFSEQFF